MRILAAFGDERYAYMAAQARAEGLDVRTYGLERSTIIGAIPIDPTEIVRVDAVIAPNLFAPKLQRPLADDSADLGMLLSALSTGTPLLLFGASGAPERIKDRFPLIDLSQDELLTLANAELTAEGALYCAMQRAKCALLDSDCLIIGYGRIGRGLTERLVALGARTTVAARRDEARRRANQRGAYAVSMDELPDALPRMQFVFSTPPELVMGERELSRLPRGALVIDLAGPPHGVDLDAAARLGIQAWLEPALPGRYCPKSAGHALLRAAQVALKEVI